MARYDRIAPLDVPSREEAFGAWSVLRDLEERERDAEQARRVRLRFLALRPVRRLLARGLEAVPAPSFDRQVEGVREELGQLGARDPERARLAQFLHGVQARTPLALVGAALDLGEGLEADGQYHGAEEYYRTGLELATTCRLPPEQGEAMVRLARVHAATGRGSAARAAYERAADLALEAGDRPRWAEARAGLARTLRAAGETAAAAAVLEDVLDRGERWRDVMVVTRAAAGLCTFALEEQRWDDVLSHGWGALHGLDTGAGRRDVLRAMAAAFASLGLFRAAERCYAAVAEDSAGAERAGAAAARALVAAEARSVAGFREARQALLGDAAEWGALPSAAEIHLTLARGCLLVGEADPARDHVREALAIGRRQRARGVRSQAEALLSALESGRVEPLRRGGVAEPGEPSRRIAAEVEANGWAVSAGGV